MKVMFHNKGMDMINLSRILNSEKVTMAVPKYLRGPPPIVSYTYTRTIFNNRKVVNELNMNCGTAGMVCSCNSSMYKYESRGHVVTGDLSIIKDVKLRNLTGKCPAYREQNNINWRVNLKNCKAAVSRYANKWAREANVDRRVLRDWEEPVYKFIDEKIRSLKQRKINKRKKHVLKSRVHLDNLNKLHDKFVLVPADKASNNVIVVCKKYYLDVVIKELNLNNTYKEIHNNSVNIISNIWIIW